MAQKLFEDKITTLSESGGTITLASGARLTIGGQQYITDSALNVSADTAIASQIYRVFAIVSGGVVSLVTSTNSDDVGPAGNNSWKLVGGYYVDSSNALATIWEDNNEYLKAEITTTTNTSSADTWTNVVDSTLTLGPGTWDIGYDVSLFFAHASGTYNSRGNCRIYNNTSGSGVDKTTSFVDNGEMTGTGDSRGYPASRRTQVTITDTTDFILQIRSSVASSSGVVRVITNSQTATLSDPDNESVFWARKIND